MGKETQAVWRQNINGRRWSVRGNGISLVWGRKREINPPSKSCPETIQSAPRALKGVHDVERRDGPAVMRICEHSAVEVKGVDVPLRVLGVGDGVANDILEENLEHAASLLVDEPGNALHAAAARQTADRGLGDSCGSAT